MMPSEAFRKVLLVLEMLVRSEKFNTHDIYDANAGASRETDTIDVNDNPACGVGFPRLLHALTVCYMECAFEGKKWNSPRDNVLTSP